MKKECKNIKEKMKCAYNACKISFRPAIYGVKRCRQGDFAYIIPALPVRGTNLLPHQFMAANQVSTEGWVKSVPVDQGTRRPFTQMSCLLIGGSLDRVPRQIIQASTTNRPSNVATSDFGRAPL